MPDLREALAKALEDYGNGYSAREYFSCLSLSVSLPGARTVNATWGRTEHGGVVDVTPSHLFQIGSNTKAFTAVGALLASSEYETFKLGNPIAQYLQPYDSGLEFFGDATVEQLLSMTARLGRYDDLPAWEHAYAAAPEAFVSAQRLVELVVGERAKEPWHYSNTGYLLTQLILDVIPPRIGTLGHFDWMSRAVQAGGLGDTHYTMHQYSEPEVAGRIVAGYYVNDEPGLQGLKYQDVRPFSLSWAQSAGSMVSTPQDLAVWARKLYQERSVLPEPQMRELLKLRSCTSGALVEKATATDPKCFGLGVTQAYDATYDRDDRVFWYYVGQTLGFRSMHAYWPGCDVAVAVFMNSRPTKANDASKTLIDALYAIIRGSL